MSFDRKDINMIKINKKEINMTCFPNGELKFEKLDSSILKEKNKIYFKYENESDLISLFLLKKLNNPIIHPPQYILKCFT